MGCGCGGGNKATVQPKSPPKEKKKKIVKIVNGKKYTYYV